MAITVLAIGLFYRRHRRSDLVVLYVVDLDDVRDVTRVQVHVIGRAAAPAAAAPEAMAGVK